MAESFNSLDSRTTDGRLAWDKYIYGSKNWKDIVLTVGKNTFLFQKKGNKLTQLAEIAAGEEITLLSNKFVLVDQSKYAHAKYKKREGYVPLKALRKPTNFKPTAYEAEVVDMINKFIRQNQNIPIDIKIAGDNIIYKKIAGAKQVDIDIKRKGGITADPKADIILYQDKNDLLTSKNIFVSHKKEGGASAFQQYGGLSKKAGEDLYTHPETIKFLKAVANNIEDGELKTPMFMKIKDNLLKNMAIFGPDYGSSFGLQHVQVIGQGTSKLTPLKKENTYELSFSDHTVLSGNLTDFVGDYLPVFGARYAAGRGFELDGIRYDGARVGIFPYALIGARTGIIEVK